MLNKTIALSLLLSACATEATTEPTESTDDTAQAAEPAPIADLTVQTQDGAYRYRFYDADGAIATMVDAPLGAPVPKLPSDQCALDTFARVAPRDAVVPPALVAACPRTLAQHGRLTAGEVPGSAQGIEYTPSAPICSSEAANDARAEELRTLGEYRPTIYSGGGCSGYVCDTGADWDEYGCYWFVNGIPTDSCADSDWIYFQQTYGSSGEYCQSGHSTGCSSGSSHPDPACAHSTWAHGDWHYTSWHRYATGTAMRGEFSNCGTGSASGAWKVYNPDVGAWSSSHPFTVAPNTLHITSLSAGWDSGNDWRTWTFDMTTSGGLVNVASAGVDLGGLDSDHCPIHLF